MKRSQHAFYLSWILLLTDCCRAQSTDILNIDCGAISPYVDSGDLSYATDDKYIESGTIFNLSSTTNDASVEKRYWNLRSFPTDKRNCYRMESVKGAKYLIRAEFYYGNYDSLNRPPQFDLYIGTDFWKTVNVTRSNSEYSAELITIATSNILHICLLNTDHGNPFISAIRLLTLPQRLYQEFTSTWSLILYNRWNAGSLRSFRYPDDPFLRIWDGWSIYDTINTASDVGNNNDFQTPSKVLQTASVPKDNEDSFDWRWTQLTSTDQYHIALHFAELEILGRNEFREFDIYLGGNLLRSRVIPYYLNLITIYNTKPSYGTDFHIVIKKTSYSTRPPLINALEVFQVKKFMDSTTDREDVEAIMGIKDTYQIKRNWMGDPCLPKDFAWSGLTCNNNDPPRITALNLSSSGLVGNIALYLARISSIEYIDLSNNNLSGAIPEILALLTSLKELNLSNNSLSGSIPNSLKERNGLKLSTENNPGLIQTKKKSSPIAIIISATVAGFILSVALTILCIFRRKNRQKSLSIPDGKISHKKFELSAAANKKFTYSEVLKMTNNFENIIGKGGFGYVYGGFLEGMRVAVKVLSESSKQGSKEFSTEINLLMKIHHKNLVSLIGYCHEDTKMVLIYEYMERGNLQNMISSDSTEKPNFLSWKQRLHIALDAAQGLEYLHHGCKPPIIHRDVKTANILLNERLEAKVADFGLSKAYPTDGSSHLSTAIMGTPGYIDPQYYALSHLNEKSDVYSFGVVLLELLTGDPPLEKNSERNHIVQRVNSILQKGDIREVIDPRLNGECDTKSAWKFAEIALECTLQSSVERPCMNKVANELKECLISETSKYKQRYIDETERYILSDPYLDPEPSAR